MDRADLQALPVDSAMRLWPQTIRVFLEHRMLCVGCPVGRLHTIEEACAAHGIDPDAFLQALRSAQAASPCRIMAEPASPPPGAGACGDRAG